MHVRRLCWLGVRVDAEAYEPMVGFLRDVLGMRVDFAEATTVELSLPSGDRVQLFGPSDRYHEFFGAHARGPVVALFEVDDVRAARDELVAAGIEIVGELERDAEWEWVSFRAPDGNLYELASRVS
jgi:catechol 2,3-dioxygenase-like lactoylglutathione lyase family enzyme